MATYTKKNKISNIFGGVCESRKKRTLRRYKAFLKIQFVRKEFLRSVLTVEENISRNKRLIARGYVPKPRKKKKRVSKRQINDGAGRAEIKPDSLVGERDISWICEIELYKTMGIFNNPDTFSTECMHSVTTFGTVIKSTQIGSLEVFVIDEGTGSARVVFDKTRHCILNQEIQVLEDIMQSDYLFPQLEKEHILRYMRESTSLLESNISIRILDNVMVFGHLSQKCDSFRRIIVASHVFHIDWQTMSSLSCQLASKLRLRSKSVELLID